MSDVGRTTAAAAVCSFCMIAHQVAGKATRDALFLDRFAAAELPRMIVLCALLTIVAVLAASYVLPRVRVGRVVPAAFLFAAVLQLAIAAWWRVAPDAAVIAFYLHVSVLGLVLISWFWSVVCERFNPRTARRRVAQIAGGGALGGLLGGAASVGAAERVPVQDLLWLLAILHALCALTMIVVGRGVGGVASGAKESEEPPAGTRLHPVLSNPYLRNVALLVLTVAVATAFLDFVFKAKAEAWAGPDGASLRGLFGRYHTGVAAMTLLLQTFLSRRLLEGPGLALTASSLPLTILLGAVAFLFVPILPVIAVARGTEAAVGSSLFRSSYELLYAPLRPSEIRSTKTLLDVGVDRMGDALGWGLVQIAVLLGVVGGGAPLAVGAAILGMLGVGLTWRLRRLYIGLLERNLLDGEPSEVLPEGAEVALLSITGYGGRAPLVGPTTTSLDLRKLPEAARALESSSTPTDLGIRRRAPAPPLETRVPDDLVIRGIIELRSNDARRVRRVLRAGPPTADLVPHVIQLLRWEEVAPDAQRALGLVAVRHEGQLVDALRDAEESPSVRCGVVRVLAKAGAPSAARGLLEGLGDARFAVRFECGAALARLRARHPEMEIDRAAVHAAVEREARVDRHVWERTQVVEAAEGAESPFFEDVLKERVSLSLQHVFTLLSLVYPERNLRVAYQALQTDDENLRGNALEYLESILPRTLRDSLWPFLDDHRAGGGQADADSALDSLLESHPSILENLESLRRRAKRERR